MERTDAQLVALARLGDRNAFGELVKRYQPMAKRIAKSMVANEDAQDLVQEAMLQAYLSLKYLRDDNSFKNWLYGIVLNVCRSYIRDRHAVFFSLEAMIGGLHFDAIPFMAVAPDPQRVAEEQELYSLVLAAVNTLSPKNRTATLLFYQDQLSIQDIAALLDTSVSAIKGRLHKSRIQLRAKLLALYPEQTFADSVAQRKNNMIKVTVVDVIPQEETQAHIVVLWDEANRRLLPIWVGRWEGEAIAFGMTATTPPRPLTYQFIANLLEAAGAEIESVQIATLVEGTYYAVVSLCSGDRVREVDTRPSDAIALALRVNCPIYVAENILSQQGFIVPAEIDKTPIGKGLQLMNQKQEQKMQEHQEQLRSKQSNPSFFKEEKQRKYQELMTLLFSNE